MYAIALLPFCLNVSPNIVEFTVKPILVQRPDEICASANELASLQTDDRPYFPPGYQEYFTKVCQRASRADAIWDVAPDCGIRVIAGHGLRHKKCGKLFCDEREIMFQEFGDNPASILSVFDICNSQFAVAALGGHYLNTSEPKTSDYDRKKRWGRKLCKRREWVKNCEALFACDNSDLTWPFRVAESICPDSPEDFSCMSKPFGDAVALSVLGAVNNWEKGDRSAPLDVLFEAYFKGIRTDFVLDSPAPVSRPTKLQAILESGGLSCNYSAFNSKLFQSPNLWYFTTDRMPCKPSFEDGVEEALIQFIVGSLALWHKANGNEPGKEYPKSVEAWRILSNMLGLPFSSIRLEENDSNGILEVDQDGTLIQVWAETCRDLPAILKQAQNLLASGSLFDGEEDSDFVVQ